MNQRFAGGGDVGVEAALRRHDDVQHLALAGIIGTEQVAGADLDPNHLLGRDSRERDVERFGLGARPGAVDHDIAGGARKAAHVDLALVGLGRAEVERETGHALGDVERACAAHTARRRPLDRRSSGHPEPAAGLLARRPAGPLRGHGEDRRDGDRREIGDA